MKKPLCKLCGERHWVYERHGYPRGMVESVRRGEEDARARRTVTKLPEFVTKVVTKGLNNVTGRPRRYETNAERQKAYRRRRSGSIGDERDGDEENGESG